MVINLVIVVAAAMKAVIIAFFIKAVIFLFLEFISHFFRMRQVPFPPESSQH